MWGGYEFYPDENRVECSPMMQHDGKIVQTVQGISEDFLNGKFYMYVVWAKLFKKKILADIQFKHIRYGEDSLFMYEVLNIKHPVFYLSDYVGYKYIRWGESATKNISIISKEYETFQVNLKLIREYIQNVDDIKIKRNGIKRYLIRFTDYLFSMVTLNLKNDFLSSDLCFKEYMNCAWMLKEDYFKLYIIIYLYRRSRYLCWNIMNIMKFKTALSKAIKKRFCTI